MPSTTTTTRWVLPSAALPHEHADRTLTDEQVSKSGPKAAALITTNQVRQWSEAGFCLVDGVFPQELVDACCSDAERSLPAPSKTPEAANSAAKVRIGFNANLFFPRMPDSLNHITLHPRLLRALRQLLFAEDAVDLPADHGIRLTQSEVWPKFGAALDRPRGQFDNVDQRIHCDFPNHTLTFPSRKPEVCSLIIYYSDVDECGGHTALVPKQLDDEAYAYPSALTRLPGFGSRPWINDRATAEAYLAEHEPAAHSFRAELYKREVATKYRPGSVLFYRHDVWHRGTPLKPGAMRRVHNLSFKRADAEWITCWNHGWAKNAYSFDPKRPIAKLPQLIAAATVEQRAGELHL